MKTTIRLAVVLCLAALGSAAGQESGLHEKIAVDYKCAALADVLNDIEAKTGTRIAYTEDVVEGAAPVTLSGRDAAAGRVLTRILRQRGLKVASYDESPLTVVRHNWYEPLVEKEEVYGFVKKPAVTKLGNGSYAIEFETKGFCDCTVAIENGKGQTVRHLASGVLGVNAPEQFVWNSKKQRVVWDGKDDRGRPVSGPVTARASLGLKARMERTLFWSPHKRPPDVKRLLPPPCIVARPEGIYVFDGYFGDHLRLFDRDGKYVRAVFPPPADKVPGIEWPRLHPASTPERPLPLKYQFDMTTILTQGFRSYGDPEAEWPTGEPGAEPCNGCTAMAIRGTRVALAQFRLNRLSTDGSSGGLPLHGPDTWLPSPVTKSVPYYLRQVPQTVLDSRKNKNGCVPSSMAFSPDGKWLYATGYVWKQGYKRMEVTLDALPVVTRMAYDGEKGPEPWVGSLDAEDVGDGDDRFRYPAAVAVNGEGRVYVCDYMNGRVQVFSPEAKLLGSLKTPYPADIKIHPETGECFVFSWAIGNRHWSKRGGEKVVKPTVTRYGAFPEFKRGASWPLPDLGLSADVVNMASADFPYNGHRVAVDFWSDPPRLWMFMPHRYGEMQRDKTGGMPEAWPSNIEIRSPNEGELTPVRDFSKEIDEETALARTIGAGKMFVYADPLRGNLWVRTCVHPRYTRDFLVCIDPDTGRESLVPLPRMSIQDMAFDLDGYLYVRDLARCARFDVSDPDSWREKPFKFGQDARVGQSRDALSSVLSTPAIAGGNNGVQGLGISTQGHVVFASALALWHPEVKKNNGVRLGDFFDTHVKEYRLPVFPGRYGQTVVWIFDNDGRLVCDDGFKGAGWLAGTKMDRDGYVYAPMMGVPLFNGKEAVPMVNWVGCTLMKFKPGEARLFWEKGIQKPLSEDQLPDRPREFTSDARCLAWLEGVEWLVPEVGVSGNKTSPRYNADHGCICRNESRFDLDLYARSFCSEVAKYRICVVDSNGNPMLRIGRMGNVDDGLPLVKDGRPPNPRPIGGDEVAIANCMHVAVHTDKRLFVSDIGNTCIRSVKLDYHVSERVSLD